MGAVFEVVVRGPLLSSLDTGPILARRRAPGASRLAILTLRVVHSCRGEMSSDAEQQCHPPRSLSWCVGGLRTRTGFSGGYPPPKNWRFLHFVVYWTDGVSDFDLNIPVNVWCDEVGRSVSLAQSSVSSD